MLGITQKKSYVSLGPGSRGAPFEIPVESKLKADTF